METEDLIINEPTNRNDHEEISTWSPISNGRIFENYLNSKKKISETDKEDLKENSLKILSKCINPTNLYKTKLTSTGLCFGQIQSGKTTSMEAVFTLAADNNFRVLILLSGSVGPLVSQNTKRLDKVLKSRKYKVMRNHDDLWDADKNRADLIQILKDWENPNIIDDSRKKTIVILSMKNPSRIRKINKLFQDASFNDVTRLDKIPCIIVDDECDHHSLNSKTYKNDPDTKDDHELYTVQPDDTIESVAEKFDLDVETLIEINPDIQSVASFKKFIGKKINKEFLNTATHLAITNLRKCFNFHTFLGYTATPNASLVLPTINHLSPSFSEIINPGKEYTGLEFFFSKQSKLDKFVDDIEEDIRKYEDIDEECPPSLDDAYFHFLISVACSIEMGKANDEEENQNMSMIIHPSRLNKDQNQYKRWIEGRRDIYSLQLSDEGSEDYQNLIKRINQKIKDIKKKSNDPDNIPVYSDNLKSALFEALSVIPVEFNRHDKARIPTIEYENDYANILIGGFGLDRGYTVEGLTVTYMSRSIGGGQEDTLLQRARFFGYNKNNEDFIKIFMGQELQFFFETEYKNNNNLMNSLKLHMDKNKNLKDMKRVWLGKGRGNFKITRNTIRNDLNLSVVKECPKSSIRGRYAQASEEKIIQFNSEICKKFINKNDNQFLDLKDFDKINKRFSWAKDKKIKLNEKLTLKEVYEDLINPYQQNIRDNKFSTIEHLINYYLNPTEELNETQKDYQKRVDNASKLLCPVLLFNNETTQFRSTSNHGESNKEINLSGSVATDTGPVYDENKKLDINREDLYPGDVNVHYEFLQGKTIEKKPETIPTLQVHRYNITEQKNSTDPVLVKEVYYLSLFLSEECFQEIIIGSRRGE